MPGPPLHFLAIGQVFGFVSIHFDCRRDMYVWCFVAPFLNFISSAINWPVIQLTSWPVGHPLLAACVALVFECSWQVRKSLCSQQPLSADTPLDLFPFVQLFSYEVISNVNSSGGKRRRPKFNIRKFVVVAAPAHTHYRLLLIVGTSLSADLR